MLSVSLTPFANADTFNQSLARLAVKDTPAADPQPEQRWMKTFEWLYIADPGLEKSSNRHKYPQRCFAVNGAEVSAGLIGPMNVFLHLSCNRRHFHRFSDELLSHIFSNSTVVSPKSASTVSMGTPRPILSEARPT